MISRILIIASGGLLAYSKSFIDSPVEEDLVSGFLTAMANFAMEIKGGQVKSLNFRNFNFIYSYDEDLDVIFVLVVDIDDIEEEAREKVEVMKVEFLKRFRKSLEDWSGDVTQFREFDDFVDKHIFIPPKILLVGEDGVGKTSMLNLFPGETVLELDEDLNEIIQKPIKVEGMQGIKQFVLREMNIEELIENSKYHRPYLNTVDIVFLVTNSGASNLGRTKKHYSRLKPMVKKADFYIIANFQDLKDQAFEPDKIEKAFELKVFPFSTKENNDETKSKMYEILVQVLQKSILDKIPISKEVDADPS